MDGPPQGEETPTLATGNEAEPQTSPVVIFGAPRSGTTYVTEILNAHPRVHITNEAKLFVWARLTLGQLDSEHVALTHRERFKEYLKPELARLIRRFYWELDPSALVWGDKNPDYARRHAVLQTVADLFRGARFIHVIRDGRDVVASLLRKRNADGEPWASFEEAHRIWNENITTAHAFVTSAPPGTALEVRYEELIADDLEMARKMCEFVEIDLHPRIVEFCEMQRERRTPIQGPTRDLSQGADQSGYEMVMSEVFRSESLHLLRKNLVRFGYRI